MHLDRPVDGKHKQRPLFDTTHSAITASFSNNVYLEAIEKGKTLCRELDSLYRVYDQTYPPLQTSEKMWRRAYDNAAYSNQFDAKSGVIVCSENFKSGDSNPPERKLWPLEVLWQSWVEAARVQNSRTSNLKAVVRWNVVNDDTKAVIWSAAKLSTSTRENLEDHSREYTNSDDGYFAILGSINGASTMRMLIDHKADIKYRTVEKVFVLGNDALTMAEPENRTFVLLLSPPRSLPSSHHRLGGKFRPCTSTRCLWVSLSCGVIAK